MKLSIFKVSLALGLVWGIYAWVQSNIEKTRQEKLSEQAELTKKSAIQELVKRDSADTSWMKSLIGEKYTRYVPLMTNEIEKVWITGRPILFLGEIIDVYTQENSRTRIILEHSVQSRYLFLGSDLRVDLRCDPELLEEILSKVKAQNRVLANSVAITALIDRIERASYRHENTNMTVHIGHGTCKSALFIGSHFSWPE